VKPYATLRLTESQFASVYGCVSSVRKRCWEKWTAATDPAEKAYYFNAGNDLEALIAEKFDPVLVADTSQDAVEDEDEEDDG
jgi:hypothetical protein